MLIGALNRLGVITRAVRQAIADLYAIGGASPELVFDFAEDYYRTSGSDATFDTAITHARNSNATMVDSDGLLKWAPHNLLTYSEDLTTGNWTTTFGTVNPNVIPSPAGTMTADEIVKSASGSSTGWSKSVTLPGSGSYTAAIYAKKTATCDKVIIRASLFDVDTYIWFTLVGAGSTSSGVGSPVATITALADDWYLCAMEFSTTVDLAGTILFYPAVTNGSFTTSENDSLYGWGAHLYRSDLGGMVDNPDRDDSYVPTTTSARYLPRRGHHVYNGSAWVNEGLLVESEARTNVAYYSNDISETTTGWTVFDTITAPATGITGIDGVSGSPFKLIAGSGGNTQVRRNQNSVTSGSDYAVCAILKDAGDGVYAGFSGLGIAGANEVPLFDLVNGTVDVAGTTTVVKEAGIYSWNDDGWYFCWARVTAGGAAGFEIGIAQSATDNTGGSLLWTGDDTSGYYVAYVGCEQTSGMPSFPIPTAGAAVTRAAETLTVPAAQLPWPEPNVIGSELVTNGTFDTDLSGWTNGNDHWQIISGAAYHPSSSAYNGLLWPVSLTAGKVYFVSFDVVDISSGTLRVTGVTDLSYTTSGTKEFYFVATGSETNISFGRFFGTTLECTIDNVSVKEIDPLSVSIQMDGRMTYADTGGFPVNFFRWYLDGNNYIQDYIDAQSTRDGHYMTTQEAFGVNEYVREDAYDPGVNVPYNVASRHGSTFINGAADGISFTADTTPTALPDLSAIDLQLAYKYMGTIKLFRVWANDLGDAGIATASITPPAIYGVPTISGEINDPEVGETLTAVSAPVVIGEPTPSTTWQWLRDGAFILGETSSTYTLVSADLGSKISVKQTETNGGGEATATSAETATVTGIPATATQQRDGGYIFDRSGGYIEVRA